ncbi:MAG: FKBP-type peptidyl-prolyl cis-trans isomerase [Woeseia sp.]
MNPFHYFWLVPAFALLAACGSDNTADTGNDASQEPAETAGPASAPAGQADGSAVEIEPGLSMRILSEGSGETAKPGQTAVVHYTGWLYDPSAPDNRGQKFDSSLDRGQHFEFPIGAGRVIQGWDRGVAGMQVGEVRELVILPELAYGERGAGGVIPPGATLVFEVELADLVGEPAPASE